MNTDPQVNPPSKPFRRLRRAGHLLVATGLAIGLLLMTLWATAALIHDVRVTCKCR